MTKNEKDLAVKVGMAVTIVILIILLCFLYFGRDKDKSEPKVDNTEQVYPESTESTASQNLKEDIQGLTEPECEEKAPERSAYTPAPEESASTISGVVFNYQGKPDLSFVEYDFGIYLTPVTAGSNVYVPIKFLTKKYISNLATQVPGLEPSSVPMTDKANPGNRPPGKAWSLDKSGTAYYFVDFGQRVKKSNNNSTVQIPLNAYAGQKPGGYEIWLMYEAAVLNKQGFTQSWTKGNFISNGDEGYDYAGYFQGFEYLK